MNFLDETIDAILHSGHTLTDLMFIGSEAVGDSPGYSCTWDEFRALANFDYDNGYGGQAIATDLIIMFTDGQKLWRNEYDGNEWWEFSHPFSPPNAPNPIQRVKGDMSWTSLHRLHENNGEY